MRDIPFYKNREDNMSCMLAAMRSALEYLTGDEYSWEDMEKLTGYEPKKAAWTLKPWAYLADHGFDIRMIEPFDYPRYQKEGKKYLQSYMKPEALDWQLKNSNILEIRPLIPKFLKTVDHQQRSPQLKDIDRLLHEGYLVFVTGNSRIINDIPGYSSHMLLIHDQEGDTYIAHDSGLRNAQANRRIPKKLLFKAMGGKANTEEVTGIKLTH